MDKEATPLAVIRDGVVTQMADHAGAGLPDHLSFSQYAAGLSGPLREIAQALLQLLSAGAAFNLEISIPCLPAVMCEAEKCKLLWFLAELLRILARVALELDECVFSMASFSPIPSRRSSSR